MLLGRSFNTQSAVPFICKVRLIIALNSGGSYEDYMRQIVHEKHNSYLYVVSTSKYYYFYYYIIVISHFFLSDFLLYA